MSEAVEAASGIRALYFHRPWEALMARKARKFVIGLTLVVLLGGLGVGTMWIVKRSKEREGDAHQQATRAYRQRDYVRAAELARKALLAKPNLKKA